MALPFRDKTIFSSGNISPVSGICRPAAVFFIISYIFFSVDYTIPEYAGLLYILHDTGERQIMDTNRFIIKILRTLFIICTGGMVYYNIEILFRGYSHISMFLCGGLSLYTIGILNEHPTIHPSFLTQMILGTLIITAYEFITGMVVNLILHLHVWDYSDVPFNLKGQVCLPFMFVWFFLTPVCIVTDDIIRYALFHGKKPSYFHLERSVPKTERSS